MLMASVLAVVAGSPAHAANTSGEVLVDHDSDATTASVREFGGRDRYDTALRLAKNFATGKGGLGNVPTAFVASGHTLVDAVSVSGLAGFLDAPVMLTPTDSLHGGVADFIEDYGTDTIYVLGGSAAIADSVLEDMEALANEPTVTRIEGADRYATAAAIAAKLGGGAAWCGGEDAAAILVNGGDVSLAEAMMVGPIAHRLQLPVLLTAADELPSATADFIEAEDIEHVIIVGGTDGVSEDVANAVSDAGVDTVTRIAGDTAAATSVALAGLLTGDCKDDLAPVAPALAALVHRDALPDGVAAAPVLSSTFSDGQLVPILIVGDTLPASVRDFLAATPSADTDGLKINYQLVAIGGTAAVSSSVMDAALGAAASADDLSVQIGNGGATTGGGTGDDPIEPVDVNEDDKKDGSDVPLAGHDKIRLFFSDNVIATEAELTAMVRDILEVNGAPARLATGDTPVVHGDGAAADVCNPDTVTVTLATALKAGDTISVVSGAKLGVPPDQRTVGATSVTVPATPVDRTRPTVSVIMIAGRETAEVTISEPEDAELDTADITTRKAASAATELGVTSVDGTITFDRELVAGDRITVASGAAEDGAGNKSLQRSFSAIAPHKSPRITSVLMSSLKHSTQMSTRVPEVFTTAGARITIEAKSDGAAAGAAGNAWTFVFDVASSYDAEKALDIDVRINSRDKTVFVRFNNGKAKFADLKAALEGNSAFDAMFEVKLPTDEDGGCGATANNDLVITAASRQLAAAVPVADLVGTTVGMTQVAIEVRFNGYVETVDSSGLLADVLADTAKRGGDAVTVTTVSDALGITATEDKADTTAPVTVFRYDAITSMAGMVPQVRDLVNTAAGADLIDEDPDTAAIEAREAVAAIATGFATDTNNEGKNGASQVRIGRSSGVKVPDTPAADG